MGAVVEAPARVDVRSRARIGFTHPGTGRVMGALGHHEIAVALGMSSATWRSRAAAPPPEQVARIVMAVIMRYGAARIEQAGAADRDTNIAMLDGRPVSASRRHAQSVLWGSERRSQQCSDLAFTFMTAVARGQVATEAVA